MCSLSQELWPQRSFVVLSPTMSGVSRCDHHSCGPQEWWTTICTCIVDHNTHFPLSLCSHSRLTVERNFGSLHNKLASCEHETTAAYKQRDWRNEGESERERQAIVQIVVHNASANGSTILVVHKNGGPQAPPLVTGAE